MVSRFALFIQHKFEVLVALSLDMRQVIDHRRCVGLQSGRSRFICMLLLGRLTSVVRAKLQISSP
jgi:hypothetical protein